MWLLWLLAAAGCEGPKAASPGLEPPNPRADAGSVDGEGTGGKQSGNMPPRGMVDAGVPQPMTPAGSGGMSGSSAGTTAPGQMMPPTMMEPKDEDAGSEP